MTTGEFTELLAAAAHRGMTSSYRSGKRLLRVFAAGEGGGTTLVAETADAAGNHQAWLLRSFLVEQAEVRERRAGPGP